MKLLARVLVLGLLAMPVALLAQGVDGKWVGEVAGGRGPQPVTLMLKADGGKLTGSVQGGRGGEVQISDGTVKGNDLKFTTAQQMRGAEVKITWTGTLKGDEIAFKREVEGGQVPAAEFVVKRQK